MLAKSVGRLSLVRLAHAVNVGLAEAEVEERLLPGAITSPVGRVGGERYLLATRLRKFDLAEAPSLELDDKRCVPDELGAALQRLAKRLLAVAMNLADATGTKAGFDLQRGLIL
jgi:hypothetical protein